MNAASSESKNAIADAAYLLLYSPILGAQASDYDNYEKHQKKLALGHFSVHYGSFGTALLQLPAALHWFETDVVDAGGEVVARVVLAQPGSAREAILAKS